MFERFSTQALQVVTASQQEARQLRHSDVDTEHILLALTGKVGGLAAQILTENGISREVALEQIIQIIGPGDGSARQRNQWTLNARKVIKFSLIEAMQLGCKHVEPEHILLGLIKEQHGWACQVMIKLGLDPAVLRQKVIKKLLPGLLD